MIAITGYLSKGEAESMRTMLRQHDDNCSTAFAIDRRVRQCYFLEENSDAAILLSRLFQKFGGKINVYYISNVIMPSDIPRKYYYFVENAFKNGSFIHPKWMSFRAEDYADVWEILGFSYVDLEGKTNRELWCQARKLENKVRFGFGGD